MEGFEMGDFYMGYSVCSKVFSSWDKKAGGGPHGISQGSILLAEGKIVNWVLGVGFEKDAGKEGYPPFLGILYNKGYEKAIKAWAGSRNGG